MASPTKLQLKLSKLLIIACLSLLCCFHLTSFALDIGLWLLEIFDTYNKEIT